MLLNPAANAIKAGPVARQTGSVNKTGPVFKPKSLVQLAAEKIEQSIKKPAVLPKQNNKLPTTLAAHALVKDKINYWEKKANENSSIITLDKKPTNIADMREDEMAKSGIFTECTRQYNLEFIPKQARLNTRQTGKGTGYDEC